MINNIIICKVVHQQPNTYIVWHFISVICTKIAISIDNSNTRDWIQSYDYSLW
jgi:hypothetical protein